MTIQDLQHNYTWLAFLRMWEESGRCPIEAVDFLIDCDLWEEAEVIRTAATVNRRFICDSRFGSSILVTDFNSGIYPCTCTRKGKLNSYSWYHASNTSTESCAIHREHWGPVIECKTFVEAVQRLIEECK